MSVIQASDARSWVACVRRAWYDHHPPPGFVPEGPEEFDRLISEQGLVHEAAVLRRLEAAGRVVRAVSRSHTLELMRDQVPVVHQPEISRDDVTGRPDFLVRVSSGAYQPGDAKLTRKLDRTKPEGKAVVIQLGGLSAPAR